MRGNWHLPAFAALLALALLATLPLRLAGLDRAGVAASAVDGTIWRGRLSDATVGGLAIGDIEIGLAPLSLPGGALRMDATGAGLQATIVRRAGGFGLAVPNGRIGPFDMGGIPIASVDFAGLDIDMRDGACLAAAGQVQVRAATGRAGEDALIATARCDGGAVVLPLASTSGRTRLDIRIDGNRRYKAVLVIDGANDAERAALLAAGFQSAPDGLARTMEGGF